MVKQTLHVGFGSSECPRYREHSDHSSSNGGATKASAWCGGSKPAGNTPQRVRGASALHGAAQVAPGITGKSMKPSGPGYPCLPYVDSWKNPPICRRICRGTNSPGHSQPDLYCATDLTGAMSVHANWKSDPELKTWRKRVECFSQCSYPK